MVATETITKTRRKRLPRSLDLVGTAEAALNILGVERARIGRWRRIGILLPEGKYPGFTLIESGKGGTRIAFPEPIHMETTAARLYKCGKCKRFSDYVEPKNGRKVLCPNCEASLNGAETVEDHSKLAATPLWWADDIRRLRDLLDTVGARDD